MVQGSLGDDRVELLVLLEILELQLPEQRAVRSGRVDARHVVARRVERAREQAGAAADLEHAGGTRRQV